MEANSELEFFLNFLRQSREAKFVTRNFYNIQWPLFIAENSGVLKVSPLYFFQLYRYKGIRPIKDKNPL